MWPAIAAIAGSQLIGGFMNQQAQASANQANISMSREQMQFQERMSSTAHQREVEDLRKAGLNPILSATHGGASAPSGSMAVSQSTRPGDAIANAVSSGLQARQLKKDIDATDSQIGLNLIKGATEKVAQSQLAASAFKEKTAADRNNLENQVVKMNMPAIQAEAETRKKQAKIDYDNAELDKKLQQTGKVMGAVQDTVGSAVGLKHLLKPNPNTKSGSWNDDVGFGSNKFKYLGDGRYMNYSTGVITGP